MPIWYNFRKKPINRANLEKSLKSIDAIFPILGLLKISLKRLRICILYIILVWLLFCSI